MSLLINYFLISLPEMAAVTIITFVLYGINMSIRRLRLTIYVVVTSFLTFLGEQIFGASSIKVLLLTSIMIFVFYLTIRFKFQYTIMILFTSIVILGIIQSTVVLMFDFALNMTTKELIQHLNYKVYLGFLTDGLLLLLSYLMVKKRWQLKLSRIER
jgi:hypothetical protein